MFGSCRTLLCPTFVRTTGLFKPYSRRSNFNNISVRINQRITRVFSTSNDDKKESNEGGGAKGIGSGSGSSSSSSSSGVVKNSGMKMVMVGGSGVVALAGSAGMGWLCGHPTMWFTTRLVSKIMTGDPDQASNIATYVGMGVGGGVGALIALSATGFGFMYVAAVQESYTSVKDNLADHIMFSVLYGGVGIGGAWYYLM
jgi:hypothetical protein